MQVMLATDLKDIDGVKFPVYASPKIDGIRAYIKDGVVYSRSGKPIPNQLIQAKYGNNHGFDGELFYDGGDFSKTTSIVLSPTKPIDNIKFVFFDRWDRNIGFEQWYYFHRCSAITADFFPITQTEIVSKKDLLRYEQDTLDKGYEGVMIRYPDSLYTQGRSTELLKMKRYLESEAEVICAKCRNNIMKHLVVKDIHTGVEFNLSSGFTAEMREDFYDVTAFFRNGYVAVYKYLGLGNNGKPRHPVFLGTRWVGDL